MDLFTSILLLGFIIISTEGNQFNSLGKCISSIDTNEKKILKCVNTTIELVNRELSSTSTSFYNEIKLQGIVSSNINLILKNEHFLEKFEWTQSNVTDKQIELLFNEYTNFNNLESLNLSGNLISKVKQNYFRTFKKIKIIDLSKNIIQKLPFDVFNELFHLNELYLNVNDISSISSTDNAKSLFIHLQNLKKLDLSQNKINDLPHNVFKGLKNLNVLNLSENQLKIIPFQLFRDFYELEILDLSGNGFISFLDNFFITNKKIRILRLNDNHIEKLTKNSLFGLKSLHTLDLSTNKLIYVDRNAFQSLVNLKYLYLNNNELNTISSILFSAQVNLNLLDLSKNPYMKILPNGIFAQQFELTQLMIEETGIEYLSNWISRDNKTVNKNILINLKYISIKNNSKLREIEPCTFKNTPAIERLIISGNPLTYIPKEIGELNKLKFLDLSGNKLVYVPEQIKDLNYLEFFNMIDNEFSCDCRMYWIVNWIENWQNQINNVTKKNNGLYKIGELKCRNGYPGDMIRVLQHLHCIKPILLQASESNMHLLLSDAVLECSFTGNPAPDIIWVTPLNQVFRHYADPDIKYTLVDTNEKSAEFQMLIQRKNKTFSTKESRPGVVGLLENGSLKVNKISRRDSGVYTCYAYNIMGNATADIR